MSKCCNCVEASIPSDMLFAKVVQDFGNVVEGNIVPSPIPPNDGDDPYIKDGEDIEGSKGFGYVMSPEMYAQWRPVISEEVGFNELSQLNLQEHGKLTITDNTWIIENTLLPPYTETEDGHDWYIGSIWAAIRIPKLKPGTMASGDVIKFRTGELYSIGGEVEWLTDTFTGLTYGDLRNAIDQNQSLSTVVEDQYHYYIGMPTPIFWSPTFGFHLVEITYWNIIYRGKEYIFGVTLRDDVPINGES